MNNADDETNNEAFSGSEAESSSGSESEEVALSTEIGDEGIDMNTRKQRFAAQKLVHKRHVYSDSDDDEETESQKPKDPFITGGPLSDIRPVKRDPEGRYGYRCRHCPDKILQSDQDAIFHVQSKFHKKSFKKARRAAMTEEDIKAKQAKHKRKQEKRKADEKYKNKSEERKLQQKKRKIEKLKQLSTEEISKRKEKARRKKERRMGRKQKSVA